MSVIYTGMSIGSLVSTIVTGWLCSTNILGGWPLPFYVFGKSVLFSTLLSDYIIIHLYEQKLQYMFSKKGYLDKN